MKYVFLPLLVMVFLGLSACEKKQTKTQDKTEEETVESMQLKEVKQIYPKVYASMQKVPQCIEQSKQVDKCLNEVKILNESLARAMGYVVEDENVTLDVPIESKGFLKIYHQSIEDTKQSMVCIEDVESMEEVRMCLK